MICILLLAEEGTMRSKKGFWRLIQWVSTILLSISLLVLIASAAATNIYVELLAIGGCVFGGSLLICATIEAANSHDERGGVVPC